MGPSRYVDSACGAACGSPDVELYAAIPGIPADLIPYPQIQQTGRAQVVLPHPVRTLCPHVILEILPMDRRTLIGLVLIFVILTGYPLLMQKFFPQESPVPAQEETTAVADSTGQPVDLPEQPQATHVTEALPRPAGGGSTGDLVFIGHEQKKTISVRTPLYALEISTLGGRIVKWEGLDFHSWKGGPVNLIPDDIPDHGADIVFFRNADLDLGRAIYTATPAALDLVPGGGSSTLTLRAPLAGGLAIDKIFTFNPETYDFHVELVIVGSGPEAMASLAQAGTPDKIRFGWNQGIAPTERIQRMETASMRSAAMVGEELHFKKLHSLAKGVEKVTGQWRGSARFAALQNSYFTVVGMVPAEQGEPVEGTVGLGGDQATGTQSWFLELPARRGVNDELARASLDFYIGPQDAELLQSYGVGLEKAMDLGWKVFRPMTEAVLWALSLMHRFIPNYGVIIILFSILTKVMFYPLTKTSTQSMKKMQEIQPKLKALQEKYKDDKEKLNQATMKLYKDEKVNPAAGCLPMLVQTPVFIALYQALRHTISLRGQPFFGWITDLSQPDSITSLPFSLPFLGSDVNVLPILMAVAMYYQTKLTPTTGAGGQMAAMNTMMPLFMVFIFYNMPSGLVLYYLVNTILQGYQTWQIHKTAPGSEGAQAT